VVLLDELHQGVDAILSRGGNLTRQREWRREAA